MPGRNWQEPAAANLTPKPMFFSKPHLPATPLLMTPQPMTHEEARWISITNLPREANDSWLRVVFAPIAPVERVEFASLAGTGVAYLRFAVSEQARAALSLDGYVALGIPLRVCLGRLQAVSSLFYHNHLLPSPILSPPPLTLPAPTASAPPRRHALASAQHRVNGQPAAHKNLYILNLPLDATTDQLAALFGEHGSVVHCVILAMLDAQARRRGFIDMATPDEARRAIEALNGFVWNGYPIEVSYAIVQRSGGPLSGPNVVRRTVPRSRWNCGPRRQPFHDTELEALSLEQSTFSPKPAVGQIRRLNAAVAGNHDLSPYQPRSLLATTSPSTCVDPFSVLISGIDPVAIIDEEDLVNSLPDLAPVNACSLPRDENGVVRGYAFLTFGNASEAANACATLDGKVQNGSRLSCKPLQYCPQPLPQPSAGLNFAENMPLSASPCTTYTASPAIVVGHNYQPLLPNRLATTQAARPAVAFKGAREHSSSQSRADSSEGSAEQPPSHIAMDSNSSTADGVLTASSSSSSGSSIVRTPSRVRGAPAWTTDGGGTTWLSTDRQHKVAGSFGCIGDHPIRSPASSSVCSHSSAKRNDRRSSSPKTSEK